MTLSTSAFPPTRMAALEKLQNFLPRAGKGYAARRNYDLGSGGHTAVSTLSPYLRTRLITEPEVLQAVLGRFSFSSAEKFIQEVFWRTYWKGWLEMRPSVWHDYQAQLAHDWDAVQTQSGLRDDWEAACLGKTGIDCFDSWANELVRTGYLHNHARMWFASIWMFTLRLPWALGADFFLRHLLDGDPASNTLSWRWVGGMQTQGKTYLARPDNIAKYTEGRFHPTNLAKTAMPLRSRPHPAPRPLSQEQLPSMTARTGIILHNDDVSLDHVLSKVPAPDGAVWIQTERHLSPLVIARELGNFHQAVQDDCATRFAERLPTQNSVRSIEALAGWAREHKFQQIVTAYAPVGPTASMISQLQQRIDIPVIQIRRPYDSAAWPYATHGFFRFKDKIPKLLQQLKLC